jgi:hypothetical protein
LLWLGVASLTTVLRRSDMPEPTSNEALGVSHAGVSAERTDAHFRLKGV